jgi:HrpA-like RNA helicase
MIILDEAHNGSIDNDIITQLWITAYNQNVNVPRLVLASATLTKESTIIPDIPIMEIKTKSLPVKIEYAPKNYIPDNRLIYTDLANIIAEKHMMFPVRDEDISKWLVFCAGSSEVDSICTLLRFFSLDKVKIFPAHSKLTDEQKNAIFDRGTPGYRNIIVATNIAEASITIDGLDGVFDSLTEKVSETSSSGGFRLVIKNISKSSAAQRKGRTGRTRAGFCYRMCTEKYFNELQEQREPEISRVPLTGVIVELLNVGLDPVNLFASRVTKNRIGETLKTLEMLKMIDGKQEVTEAGIFATRFNFSVYNSSVLYSWMSKEEFPLYPIAALISLIDCYGPPYFFYPKKEEGMNNKEYDKVKSDYYDSNFAKFEGANDIESMLKFWNTLIENVGGIDPNYEDVLRFCKNSSINNKKAQEVIKLVRHTCKVLAQEYGKNITVGPFNERKVFRVAEPYLRSAYYGFTFKLVSGSQYANEETGEYFRLDKKQSVNIKYADYPRKLIAFRTAEIAGAGKKSVNVISLFVPVI